MAKLETFLNKLNKIVKKIDEIFNLLEEFKSDKIDNLIIELFDSIGEVSDELSDFYEKPMTKKEASRLMKLLNEVYNKIENLVNTANQFGEDFNNIVISDLETFKDVFSQVKDEIEDMIKDWRKRMGGGKYEN